LYNDFDDDELIRRYLNRDENSKTDALFDKINGASSPDTPVQTRTERAKSASRAKTDTNLRTNALFDKINSNSRAQRSTQRVNEYAPVMPERTSKSPQSTAYPQVSASVQSSIPARPKTTVKTTAPAKQQAVSASKTTAPAKQQAVSTPKTTTPATPKQNENDSMQARVAALKSEYKYHLGQLGENDPRRQSFEKMKKEENEKRAKKAKQKSIWTKVLLSLGCFLLVAVLGFVTIFQYFFGGLKIKEVDENNLNVNSELDELMKDNPTMKKITNIALFGIDAREGEENSRADAIIIMSINPMTGKIKLISVMRDSYVDIGDGYWDKINHSYYYGGPEGAIATLNSNFNLNITDYVTVDFSSMAQAIDALGGVDIDVDEEELPQVNINGYEVCTGYQELTQMGYVHLTGDQAVGYARIRNIDGDKARTGRQREVVMAAVEQIKTKKILELPGIVKQVIPMLETSMSYSEIMAFLPMLKNDIVLEQTVIPGDYDGAYDAYINEVYYMAYDLESATEHIYDFIYEDIDPNAPVAEEVSEDVYDGNYDDVYDDESYYAE